MKEKEEKSGKKANTTEPRIVKAYDEFRIYEDSQDNHKRKHDDHSDDYLFIGGII